MLHFAGRCTLFGWEVCSKLLKIDPLFKGPIEFLSGVSDLATQNKDWRKLFKTTYELLGILNHKAEALMVYSGIILAVVSVANIHHTDAVEHVFFGVMASELGFSRLIAFISLGSIFCSLIVVGIFWGFLETAFSTPQEPDFQKEWTNLMKVLIIRQRFYQFAWLLSLFDLGLLVLFVNSFGL